MNKILMAAVAASIVATSAPAAFAQPDRDHGGRYDQGRGNDQGRSRGNSEYRRHDEWRHGARIRHEDWDRGRPIDYRQNHLRRPARGYEWREVDGNYVMAAVATGLIVSAIAHSR